MSNSAEFQKAVEDSRKLKAKPSDNELLQLYAHFKQTSQDPKFEDAPQPGTFDFKGKAKYRAWTEIKDMDPAAAEKKYIELVEEYKTKYGYDV